MNQLLSSLTLTAYFAGANLSAQVPASRTVSHKMESGLEFQTPQQWQSQTNGKIAALTPPGAIASSEVYLVGTMVDMRDLNDPYVIPNLIKTFVPANMQAKLEGKPAPFRADNGNGLLHTYSLTDNGTSYLYEFYLVQLADGGVGTVMAMGHRNLITARHSDIGTIAASLTKRTAVSSRQPAVIPASRPAEMSASGSSPLVNTWLQRLTDMKLVQLSSYSSGTSGGMSSERKIYLARDGSYAFRSSSSVSIYVPGANGGSSGSNADDGKWRVIEQGGKAMLELNSTHSTRELIVLSMEGDKTFFEWPPLVPRADPRITTDSD